MSKKRIRRRKDRRDKEKEIDEKVAKIVQPLWKLPAYEIMGEERVQLVHEKSMQILEEGGIAFYDDEAEAILKEAGVDVVDQVARFDRDFVMEMLSHAPSEFTWSARNPENDVVIGGDHVCFAPVVGPPFVMDYENGRRDGTAEDLTNFIKLSQMSPYIHCLGAEIVVPSDIPMHHRHLEQNYMGFKYGDKPIMGGYGIGLMAKDSVDMARVMFGEEELKTKHALHGVINVSSPRRLDDRMLGVIHEYGRANQILNITPFILSGAMGPTSILGTVAQLNAETLAGIVYTQIINKGNPCVYGSFQSVIDLQSGSPVFGAPESQLALYLSAHMARFYNLPFRAAGAYASSKVIDAQGAYEAVLSMFPSMLVRPNFVLHAAGWLENGLTAGYEKFILDNEMLGMFHRYLEGVSWDEDEWAMDAIINEVPPGGHHLGSSHTMRHYKTAFYRAELFDYESAEQWAINGSVDTYKRAHGVWQQRLKAYEAPKLDQGKEEALRAFIDQRKTTIDPKLFN